MIMIDAKNNPNTHLSLPRDPVGHNETSSERFDLEGGTCVPCPELLHDSGLDPLLDGTTTTMSINETTKCYIIQKIRFKPTGFFL